MSAERDLVGYGERVPFAAWPKGARIAVSLIVAYEEGAENLLQDGLPTREALAELPSVVPAEQRDLANESMFEYGSRAGIWRILRILKRHEVRATFAVSALALERNPAVALAIREAGHNVLAHGYRWARSHSQTLEQERESIAAAYRSIGQLIGRPPKGWLSRYGPGEHTRSLIMKHGGFIYDCDSYNDDLPYYARAEERDWLVVPYSLVLSDSKYWRSGYATGDDFARSMREAFDVLYAEGETHPRMMSVGVHCRISGVPGRSHALDAFLTYARRHDRVWFAGRDEIAEHWLAHHPPASVAE